MTGYSKYESVDQENKVTYEFHEYDSENGQIFVFAGGDLIYVGGYNINTEHQVSITQYKDGSIVCRQAIEPIKFIGRIGGDKIVILKEWFPCVSSHRVSGEFKLVN